MCTTDVFTDVYPDGRINRYEQPNFCSSSRHGHLCASPVVYNHPARHLAYTAPLPFAPAAPTYSFHQTVPPTPPRGPSASDTERARRDSSSSDRRHRPSGVYVNGQKVLDLNRKTRSRAERIVIVDSPPTPRTPPRQFATPYTAPPSPNVGGDVPQFRNSYMPRESLRPVIVDERPRPKVEIEVVDSRHHRHQSSDSRYSHSSAENDDRRRRRRDWEREERDRQEEERQRRMRARIDEQNEKIARRAAVPLKRTSTGFAPPTADQQREQELVDAVRRLEINQRVAADRRAREREEEDEAQRQRLMERMMPRRRATVGPGSRRHRVLYDDGVYRWE
ncbi:hypothetical protein CCHL11_03144 [Colletotrichum chlorophyti]|uniref:Uncharacterized protein n=1 Tax=Colletotrichum chlorophyti TaxID=708187 RepID=A0A1Q8RGA8_9PEZI|nr:hypothetical protein CCHL11_03144 [Colletotrichum chlorophyti]